MTTEITCDLLGDEADALDAPGNTDVVVPLRARRGEPRLELPAEALGDERGGEGALVTPQPGETLPLGRLDDDAEQRTGKPGGRQALAECLGETTGDERGGVHPIGGWVELGLDDAVDRTGPER
ncbi:MAG: hypothetical protein L3J86_02710, partial [Thermoplasmata archaeon]|nr:hypothetical protein [Thermoplasmata archaeon]